MAVIDADTHVIETEHTWDYMDPAEQQFRPIVVTPKGERGREYWYIDGKIRGMVRQAVAGHGLVERPVMTSAHLRGVAQASWR